MCGLFSCFNCTFCALVYVKAVFFFCRDNSLDGVLLNLSLKMFYFSQFLLCLLVFSEWMLTNWGKKINLRMFL